MSASVGTRPRFCRRCFSSSRYSIRFNRWVLSNRGSCDGNAGPASGWSDCRDHVPTRHFSRYFAEIPRSEGLNAFDVKDLSTLNGPVARQLHTSILREMFRMSAQGGDVRGLGHCRRERDRDAARRPARRTSLGIVRAIVAHLGEPSAPPRIAPARGPPLSDMPDARAGGFDPHAQPASAYEFHQRITWYPRLSAAIRARRRAGARQAREVRPPTLAKNPARGNRGF
jgi:hypothetical protein